MRVCRTQGVQVSLLVGEVGAQVGVGFLGVLFLVLSGFGVPVSEDEVQLVIFSTFVGSKHDCVRSLVNKLVLQETKKHTQPDQNRTSLHTGSDPKPRRYRPGPDQVRGSAA